MKHEKGIILIVILISVTILCGYNYLTVNKENEHQSYDLGIITMNTTNTSNLVCKVNETGFLR